MIAIGKFGSVASAVLVLCSISADEASSAVIGWGSNSSGQTTIPGSVTNAVGIAAGAYHSLALSSDGSVVAWGDDVYGQTDVPPDLTDAKAIAAGWFHSLAIRSNGMVVAWGNDTYGQATAPPSGGTSICQ